MLPEGPCCVFYAKGCQVYWGLRHNKIFHIALRDGLNSYPSWGNEKFYWGGLFHQVVGIWGVILTSKTLFKVKINILQILNIYQNQNYHDFCVQGVWSYTKKIKKIFPSRENSAKGDLEISKRTSYDITYFFQLRASKCCNKIINEKNPLLIITCTLPLSV